MDFLKVQQQDFMKFTAYNNVLIITAAGICIGLATKEAITDFLNEVILPFIMFISNSNFINQFIKKHILENKLISSSSVLQYLFILLKAIFKTSWILTVWFLILYITYLILQKIIKIDFLTPKLDFVENASKYVIPNSNNENNRIYR